MDNCWRENKNKYLFGYCSYLVQQGVFKTVIANFFTVGHTHNDVDQMFSKFSMNLRQNNAITLNEFMSVVRSSISSGICLKSGYFENIPNISGLMEDEDWLNNIRGIVLFEII